MSADITGHPQSAVVCDKCGAPGAAAVQSLAIDHTRGRHAYWTGKDSNDPNGRWLRSLCASCDRAVWEPISRRQARDEKVGGWILIACGTAAILFIRPFWPYDMPLSLGAIGFGIHLVRK